MSFMMEIESVSPSPLEYLAQDYFPMRNMTPSLEFCRRAAALPATDAQIAHRLSVAISTVRTWRARGRASDMRANVA